MNLPSIRCEETSDHAAQITMSIPGANRTEQSMSAVFAPAELKQTIELFERVYASLIAHGGQQ